MKKFMRTRTAPPSPAPLPPASTPAHVLHNGNGKINGYAKDLAGAAAGGAGNGAARRDDHSTLSSECCTAAGAGAARGALWEDTSFPAEWRALGDRKLHDVVWRRPHELSARPQFYGEDGADLDDVSSADFDLRWCIEVGGAGCGHVCAALSALALTPRLLRRVLLPRDQGFRADLYTGAFRFMFWEWGSWREVCVDDRLPTRRGRLLSSRVAANTSDFTLPLLEKAYAKLYGSYALLRAGSVARALQDLTGGIVQSFPLAGAGAGAGLAFHVLNSAVPRSTLLVATVHTDADGAWRRRGCGLVAGQAYCVTGLARVRAGGVETPLVRARGAGGRGAWSGAWARGSPEWRALSDRDRELLAARVHHQAEFWMSFADFAAMFGTLSLVHVGPDDWLLEPALRARRPWRAVLARRRWRPGYNAGGGPQHADTTSANPQFHVSVPREEGEPKCHVVVSVCQRYSAGGGGGGALVPVGFAVYEVEAGAPRSTPLQLGGARALDVTHGGRAREVATFFTLPHGDYVVVPHTRDPHLHRAFILRILTDTHTNIWEVNEDNVIIRDIAAEFLDARRHSPQMAIKSDVPRFNQNEEEEEVDCERVMRALRRWQRRVLLARPSRELARALLALGDRPAAPLCVAALPGLMQLLHYWKHIFLKYGVDGGGGGVCGWRGAPAASAYRLRALLWAAGLTASNKVLEGLVARFARGGTHPTLRHEDLVIALARLHLAHERYRSLDTKMKSNPLSLEEMILMTIYS